MANIVVSVARECSAVSISTKQIIALSVVTKEMTGHTNGERKTKIKSKSQEMAWRLSKRTRQRNDNKRCLQGLGRTLPLEQYNVYANE